MPVGVAVRRSPALVADRLASARPPAVVCIHRGRDPIGLDAAAARIAAGDARVVLLAGAEGTRAAPAPGGRSCAVDAPSAARPSHRPRSCGCGAVGISRRSAPLYERPPGPRGRTLDDAQQSRALWGVPPGAPPTRRGAPVRRHEVG
jgi:hypothetical protein